jgi:hypothetical protein
MRWLSEARNRFGNILRRSAAGQGSTSALRIRRRQPRLEQLEHRLLLSIWGTHDAQRWWTGEPEVQIVGQLGVALDASAEDGRVWLDFDAADGLQAGGSARVDLDASTVSSTGAHIRIDIPGAWLDGVATRSSLK